MAGELEPLNLRKDTAVFLIGHYSPVIEGSKLPSRRQVLRVLFFNLREVKLTLKESADLVVQETFVFWNKARIAVQRVDHCVNKLINLYEELRKLQKSGNRKGANYLRNVIIIALLQIKTYYIVYICTYFF